MPDPTLGPVIVRLGGLLALGFGVAALIGRRTPGPIHHHPIFRKVATWAIIAPAFLVVLFVGGVPGALILAFVSMQASSEYARLLGLRRRYAWLLIGAALAVIPLAASGTAAFLAAPTIVACAALAIASTDTGGLDGPRQSAKTLLAFVHVPFLLATMVHARSHLVEGTTLVLLAGVSVALSDVAAFTIGNLVGGRRLAPRISPNKTWAGALGNVIGAYAGWHLMAGALPALGPWTGFVLPGLIGVVALVGDLAVSAVKRSAGVKDAGAMLPGFGGLLDRIDSLLLAFPAAYVAFVILSEWSV
jgi:phosphatidate cytidylyltransferase